MSLTVVLSKAPQCFEKLCACERTGRLGLTCPTPCNAMLQGVDVFRSLSKTLPNLPTLPKMNKRGIDLWRRVENGKEAGRLSLQTVMPP